MIYQSTRSTKSLLGTVYFGSDRSPRCQDVCPSMRVHLCDILQKRPLKRAFTKRELLQRGSFYKEGAQERAQERKLKIESSRERAQERELKRENSRERA